MCGDVMRHWARTFPEPGANGKICALYGVISTSVGIEGRSVARVPDIASDVVVDSGVAVGREDSSRQSAFISTVRHSQKDTKRVYPDEVVSEEIEHPVVVFDAQCFPFLGE